MHRIIEILKSNNLVKSIATLMSGSLIAQMISIAISPIMTRIYTEEQIGEYTLLLTAATMFGSIICGRYQMSIVSEQSEKNVFALIKLSALIAVTLSLFVGIGYTVYLQITNSIKMSVLPMFFWIFTFLIFTGIGHILTSYNNRNKEYKLIASVYTLKEIGKGIVLTVLGALNFGRLGLILSYFFSIVLGLNGQSKELKNHIAELKSVTKEDMIAVAKKHKKQPLFSLPASFANSFSYSVLNIFVNQLFGTIVMAYYSMSFRMLGIPLSLVSTNVSKAFFEKASREYDKKRDFRKTYLQTSVMLLAVAVPMVLVLILFAPFLFEMFFGEGWGQAGIYVRYLAPMFGIRLIVSALTPTMIICNKQNLELAVQLLFVVMAATTYILCSANSTIDQFLILVSILYSAVYIIYYSIMLKFTKQNGGTKNEQTND